MFECVPEYVSCDSSAFMGTFMPKEKENRFNLYFNDYCVYDKHFTASFFLRLQYLNCPTDKHKIAVSRGDVFFFFCFLGRNFYYYWRKVKTHFSSYLVIRLRCAKTAYCVVISHGDDGDTSHAPSGTVYNIIQLH